MHPGEEFVKVLGYLDTCLKHRLFVEVTVLSELSKNEAAGSDLLANCLLMILKGPFWSVPVINVSESSPRLWVDDCQSLIFEV